MWGYYGSKSKIVTRYPPPLHGKIIEPFAGTAQYALYYWEREVLLLDKYDVIVNLWKWLQRCTAKDILETPHLRPDQKVEDLEWDCEERKHLVGFLITGAPATPKNTPSKWKTIIRPNTQNYKLKYIADNLYRIKHWEILHGSYEDIPNQEATWFIDPPYVEGGVYYKHSSKQIDFDHLAAWSQERQGQVMVCEAQGATWLPFETLVSSRGNKYEHHEVLWYRES